MECEGGNLCIIMFKSCLSPEILFCMQDVANAVGAALGTVGGAVDYIVNLAEIKDELRAASRGSELAPAELEKKARDVALERGRESARNTVIDKKGTLYQNKCIFYYVETL